LLFHKIGRALKSGNPQQRSRKAKLSNPEIPSKEAEKPKNRAVTSPPSTGVARFRLKVSSPCVMTKAIPITSRNVNVLRWNIKMIIATLALSVIPIMVNSMKKASTPMVAAVTGSECHIVCT
jgi:hypothetical protein